MTFAPYANVAGLEGNAQVIARGPVAALELIKNLGTNGDGYFNANGAHPFEGPTPLVNWISRLAIAVLPASLTYTFGKMVGRPKSGWMLYWVMLFLFVTGLVICHWGESRQSLAHLGIGGPGMEGKEVRFGIPQSVLTAITTSNGATGSINAQPDSFSSAGMIAPLCNLLLGEITFGGLGTGLYSLIMVALSGKLAAQGRRREHAGSLPSDSLWFVAVTVVIALLLVLLNFLPALALGPIIVYFKGG